MTWPDGRKFTGNRENGQRSGEVEMEYPFGLRWSGHWKEGLLNSEVTARWPVGRKYTGQQENAKPSGYVSRGSFVNGKKEGIFTEYTLSDP